jgi:hypothetical protein
MPRDQFSSPTLKLELTPEQHEQAVQSKSGSCLIADAIKRQYPHLTRISVDMATIRITDPKRGARFVYLTPPPAQSALLYFDQGWPQSVTELTIRRAVKVTPIVANASEVAKADARRAELETKLAAGVELTRTEKASLTRIKNRPARVTRKGKTQVKVRGAGAASGGVVVHGGEHMPRAEKHPNLLAGRDRHFGAKVADPGQAFTDAVEAAVAERLAVAPEPVEAPAE